MSKAELLVEVIKENASIKEEDGASIPKRGIDSEARRSYIEAVEVKTKVNGLPFGLHTEETDEPSGRDKRLTKRQLQFASNVIDGMTPVTAYMSAFKCDHLTSATIQQRVNDLLEDANITLLLQPLTQAKKEMIINDDRMARRYVMNEWFKHSEDVSVPINIRLRALELMAKASGVFDTRAEQVTEAIDIDTLKQELDKSIALIQR
jgi:hypothetical protein